MLNRTIVFFLLLITGCYLTACTPIKAGHNDRVCRALRQQMLTNTSTTNIRQYEIVNSNLAQAQHDYDTDCEG